MGERNEKSLGGVNHVVMYAGIHNGKAMIVEEYSDDYDAYYRPIEELIFKKGDDSEDDEYWKTRLPKYAVSYLTADQRTRFTIPED